MKPAHHLRGSVRCTYDQAENCSACLGAGPAHQSAEPKRSHSGPRIWKRGLAASAEPTSLFHPSPYNQKDANGPAQEQ